MGYMETVVRIFGSHSEADKAEAISDAQLSPDERIRITIELRDRRHPDAPQQGLERVCRVVELERNPCGARFSVPLSASADSPALLSSLALPVTLEE
jgi:hypothetical protein